MPSSDRAGDQLLVRTGSLIPDHRFYTAEEVNQFDNSGPSASAKAFPLLEDAILEYFEGFETGHVIGVGTDLEMETWTQTFFENRIHLSGISLRTVFELNIRAILYIIRTS